MSLKAGGRVTTESPGPCVLSTSEMLFMITDAGPGSVLRSPWVGTVSATMTRTSCGADEVALLAQGRPERGRPVLFGPGHVEQGQTWRTRCRGDRARRGGEHCVLPVTRGPGSRRVHRGGEEKGGGRARGGGGDRGSVWGEQGFVGGCTTVGI